MVLKGGGCGGGALGERGGRAGALERGAAPTGGVRERVVSGIRGKGGFRGVRGGPESGVKRGFGGGFGKRCGSWSQLDFFWSPLLGLAQPVPESLVCGAFLSFLMRAGQRRKAYSTAWKMRNESLPLFLGDSNFRLNAP